MLLLARIISNNIINLFGFLIIKELKKNTENHLNLQKMIIILIISILISFVTMNSYQIITPLFSFFLFVFMYKILFSIKISEAIVITGIFFTLLFLSEIILLPFNIYFFPNGESRTIPWAVLLCNFLTGILIFEIGKIKVINNIYNNLIEKLENIRIQRIIIFIILTVIVIIIIFSLIADVYELSGESFAYLISILIFILLFIMYSNEQNEYAKLINKYDQLLKYVTEFERWIDKVELEKHEYKNDLAILETKVHDKEVKKFIEEKLTKKLFVDENWGNSLRKMPSGGMKGLLYYKIIFAKNNRINLRIDVSRKIRKYLQNLTDEEYKLLCHLFGIYLDNALEAASKSKEKSMSVEIYELKNKLNIVISNSFSGKLELSKLNEKGYTSKGTDHGKGLYFASEILKQTNKIQSNNRICNNYYIQRLEISEK